MERVTTLMGARQRDSALQTWRTKVLNIALAIMAVVALPPLGFSVAQAIDDPTRWPVVLVFVGMWLLIVLLAILRGVDTRIRAWIAILLGYAAGVLTLAQYGLMGDGRVYLLALPILAMVLIGPRSGILLAAVSLVVFGLFSLFAYLGVLDGWVVAAGDPLEVPLWLEAWVDLSMFLVPITIILWRFIVFQQNTLEAEQQAVSDLAETSSMLRQRVQELEVSNQLLAESPKALSTAAQVGQAVASILEPSALTRQVVDLVREQFDFYYTGLFLVDEAGQYAVLEAGTGEPGRVMKEQGHRLEVGGVSMVGAACAHRQPRVAADVRGEQVRFDNPLLPSTRAEIAVPLVVGDHLLGALDVQSEQADAFSEEIISALQLVANQVAVGLENAQLFARTQANLEELRQIHEVTTGRAWRQFLVTQPGRGQYQVGVAEVESEAWTALFGQARKSGDMVAANLTDGQTERQAMAIPVKYRGIPIGVLGIHRPADAGPWQAEELALGESLADRMALALENTRLLEEAQQRASRERLIGDVSGRIRETLDVETVMKTSADELYEALGLEEVVIRLVAEDGDDQRD